MFTGDCVHVRYLNLQFSQDGTPHQPSHYSPIRRSFQAHYYPFPTSNSDSLDMRLSAFVITVFSLFAFRQLFLCIVP